MESRVVVEINVLSKTIDVPPTESRLAMLIVLMFGAVTWFGANLEGARMDKFEQATFGGGCFWCVEAVFERLDGVKAAVSGYAGGTTVNPTYEDVCTGTTGHAEVVQITFDPLKVSYDDLLRLFWNAHDPTTLNRQGADVGTQYRSVIFTHSEEQRLAAERSKRDAQKDFDDPIVTEIQPLVAFYKAEEYHQDYFDNNRNAPYCTFVIAPKLKKLETTDKLEKR